MPSLRSTLPFKARWPWLSQNNTLTATDPPHYSPEHPARNLRYRTRWTSLKKQDMRQQDHIIKFVQCWSSPDPNPTLEANVNPEPIPGPAAETEDIYYCGHCGGQYEEDCLWCKSLPCVHFGPRYGRWDIPLIGALLTLTVIFLWPLLPRAPNGNEFRN